LLNYAAGFAAGAYSPGGVVLVDGGTSQLSDALPNWEDARRLLTPPPLAGMPLNEFLSRLRQWNSHWNPSDQAISIMLANFEINLAIAIFPAVIYSTLAFTLASGLHYAYKSIKIIAAYQEEGNGQKREGIEGSEDLLRDEDKREVPFEIGRDGAGGPQGQRNGRVEGDEQTDEDEKKKDHGFESLSSRISLTISVRIYLSMTAKLMGTAR
jgi:hypothetical protein